MWAVATWQHGNEEDGCQTERPDTARSVDRAVSLSRFLRQKYNSLFNCVTRAWKKFVILLAGCQRYFWRRVLARITHGSRHTKAKVTLQSNDGSLDSLQSVGSGSSTSGACTTVGLPMKSRVSKTVCRPCRRTHLLRNSREVDINQVAE